jgi:translation initiation factor IF-2
MMGMAQRMPQRPQMGPSPMTAGRPNPMAGFQGGASPVGPNYGGASPVGPQWGAGGPNPGVAQVQPGRFGGPAQGVGPQYGGASPVGPQGMFGGGAGIQVAQGQPPPGGWGSGGAPGYYPPDPNVQAMPLLQAPMGIGGGPQGMSDAMMHPFAPRNRGPQGIGPNFALPQRPQFPGAAQGGIMGGMGGPRMGQRPPQMPPWMQGARFV